MAMGSIRTGGGDDEDGLDATPMSEINVTPMVDVMLVLLIIFMVAAPLMTTGVPVQLPKTAAAKVAQSKKPLEVTVDKDGTRSRLSLAMHSAVTEQVDRLAERLNILATIGSVAPFVGLFGTVWGIMRSFSDIAGANNTSLAVVAPGIAEALFATAIGLFAAIPAVIAYNRMSYGINRMEARLTRFADGFHGTLSRELEYEG